MNQSPDLVFTQLMQVIESRKNDSSKNSYTKKLLDSGVEKVSAKITEEAGELIEAATETDDEDRAHLVHEAADLLYHTFVLLAHCDVGLSQVSDELKRRFGISGLEEKAQRDQS